MQTESCKMSLPPLSQSRHGDMACETLYVHKHVQGERTGESEAAARGIEIHQILATYINRLVTTKRSTDLESLDALMKGAGVESREVLERFRANHTFDPEKILATELHIQLDPSFHPIEGMDDDARTAEYEGTLDLVMLHSLTEAEIDDWKSYYQIIDADTFQSKLYPLLLICPNPSLERVKFVLEFVRYGASRCVEYTRKDLPWLKELAQRERARQRKLHELAASSERDLKASPGRHCTCTQFLRRRRWPSTGRESLGTSNTPHTPILVRETISGLNYGSLSLRPAGLFALLSELTRLSPCQRGLVLPGFRRFGRPRRRRI
jgi:hypothetical protein